MRKRYTKILELHRDSGKPLSFWTKKSRKEGVISHLGEQHFVLKTQGREDELLAISDIILIENDDISQPIQACDNQKTKLLPK